METITQIKNNANKLSNKFTIKDISKSLINFKFLKCAYILFTLNGLKNNISSFIFIAIFLYYIFSIFTFRKFGYTQLQNEIQEIMVIKEQEELKKINKKGLVTNGTIYKNNNNPPRKSKVDFTKNKETNKNRQSQLITSTKNINSFNVLQFNKEKEGQGQEKINAQKIKELIQKSKKEKKLKTFL